VVGDSVPVGDITPSWLGIGCGLGISPLWGWGCHPFGVGDSVPVGDVTPSWLGMGYPFSGWGWGAGWGYHPFGVRDGVPVGDVTPSRLGMGMSPLRG